MILAESRKGRRFIGRLDRGVDLFDALKALCREHHIRTAEVRALGSFEAVEVAEYDQERRVWKPGRKFGAVEVASLIGNVSERDGNLALHIHVTVMRDRDNGVEILGGHLNAARVYTMELVVETFDDVILRRGLDATTGRTAWCEAITVPGPVATGARAPADPVMELVPLAAPFEASSKKAPAPSSTGPSWADVAAASPPAEDTIEPDDSLAPGDVIIHPTFGRCLVQRIEGSGEFAHVRLRNDRLVRLSLDVLKLAVEGQEDNHRIFRARIDG
jgi:predicted DNA-binding protein with PD1-like motif